MSACHISLVSFIERYSQVYFNIYYWFRVVFIHLVPCSALVVLTALLVNAMRKAQDRRQLLLKQNRRSESRRLAESNWTTVNDWTTHEQLDHPDVGGRRRSVPRG